MNCYLCGETTAPVGTKGRVGYEACPARHVLQCPPQAVCYPYLGDEHYAEPIGRNDGDNLGHHLQHLRAHGLPEVARLLDYGCGRGHFVRFLQERGYAAEGYDPYESEWARRPEELYAAITLVEVVEHLGPDMVQEVRWCSEHLRPGGLLYLTTQEWRNEKPASWWYCAPASGHVSILTRAGVSWLCEALSLDFVTDDWHLLLRKPV